MEDHQLDKVLRGLEAIGKLAGHWLYLRELDRYKKSKDQQYKQRKLPNRTTNK